MRARLYLDCVKAEGGIKPDPSLRVLRVMKSNYGPPDIERRLQLKDGAFSLVGDGASAVSRIVAERDAETKFLELLQLFKDKDRNVSPNPGRSYAPAMFAVHPDAEDIRSRAFAAAMERLLKTDRIKIVTVGPPSKLRRNIEANP